MSTTHPTNVALGDHVTIHTPLHVYTGVVRGLEPAGITLVDSEDPERRTVVEWDKVSEVHISHREDVGRQRETARRSVPNSVLPHHLQRDPD